MSNMSILDAPVTGQEPVAYLVGVRGPAEDMVVELHPGTQLIGRGGAATQRVVDTHMSREHCLVLVAETGRLQVMDLHSSNGTRVNGNRVKRSVVRARDRVQVGSSIFEVSSAAPTGHDRSRGAGSGDASSSVN